MTSRALPLTCKGISQQPLILLAGLTARSTRQRLPLRHPDPAEAVTDAPRCRSVGRIVARRAGAEARDGESRVEREPRVERGPRLIQPTEMR